jgi:hypothetical protein
MAMSASESVATWPVGLAVEGRRAGGFDFHVPGGELRRIKHGRCTSARHGVVAALDSLIVVQQDAVEHSMCHDHRRK